MKNHSKKETVFCKLISLLQTLRQDLKIYVRSDINKNKLGESSRNIPWLSNLSKNEVKDTCDSIDKSISREQVSPLTIKSCTGDDVDMMLTCND